MSKAADAAWQSNLGRLTRPDNTVSRCVAERIRDHRQRKGWTLEQLAERSGLKLPTLGRWNADPTGSTSSRCSASSLPCGRYRRPVAEVPLQVPIHDGRRRQDLRAGFSRVAAEDGHVRRLDERRTSDAQLQARLTPLFRGCPPDHLKDRMF